MRGTCSAIATWGVRSDIEMRAAAAEAAVEERMESKLQRGMVWFATDDFAARGAIEIMNAMVAHEYPADAWETSR